ncbi:MAG: hypothetical protein DRI23_02980 [Candidatus Cloacimonadota bacterium]|nr:MAG: hypothetical protein DRH79_07450 [Candidatus Cloacimonadota bacterium]RLC52378.1 MAG: hypothetical protein DRI23_02980 [Candidatus Cloacimonadota bacterium]
MLKELKQQLVKDTIIKETKRQLLEKGLQKTTLRGIAKELGMAFGNIYYYFKSKADIADMVWADYTHDYLSIFIEKMKETKWQSKTGMEKLRFYYLNLYSYFKANPLYADLIAFLMGSKPRSVRAPQEIIDIADAARAAIKAVIIDLYEQAIADGSINAEIKNVTLEAWSFNVAYVALIINLTRYDDADMELHDYYINTYFDRLEGV